MKRGVVVDRKFLAGCYIAKRHHENVIVHRLHITVGFAGVVNVVGTVSTFTAIQTPTAIDIANTQSPASSASLRFSIRDFFPSVLRDFLAAL